LLRPKTLVKETHDPMKRLARNLDRLADKDAQSLARAHDIASLRRSAASELFRICSGFASELNRLLTRGELVLDPPDFEDGSFHEETANLIQMNIRGRVVQVQFQATPELVSTEDFRVPYTLQGSARAFNQDLLDRDLIEEQLIFYTLERPRYLWRYFDPRTYRSGEFDRGFLISLMERLT
jgi:hypothetical protein